MVRKLIKGAKMCQNFSDSVSQILTQIQNRPVFSKTETIETSAVRRPFTVSVEGNIGSGKSTYLKHFSRWNDRVDIIMEPVDKWRNLNSHNLLQMMYEDPKRWSLTFQTYVQLTMLQNHTKNTEKPVKLMERSLHSAKYCFAENLKRTGKMPESEYEVLSGWFDFMLQCPNIDLSVDLIVYLKTDPEVALRRVKERSRGEEHLINEQYIQDLHQLHEDWLTHQKFPVHAPVVVVDANKDIQDMREIFTVITKSFQAHDKENTPERITDDFKAVKRSGDSMESKLKVQRQNILGER